MVESRSGLAMAPRSKSFSYQNSKSKKFNRTLLRSAFLCAFLIVFLLVIVVPLGILSNSNAILFVATSFIGFLMPLAIGLRQGHTFDPFEPINMISFSILLGCSVRSVWLVTSSSPLVQQNMWHTDFHHVLANMPFILMGVFFLCLGYVAFPVRIELKRLNFFRKFRFSRSRFWFAILVIIAITIGGIMAMLNEYDISLSEGLLAASAKRYVEYTDASGNIVYGRGFSVFIAQTGTIGIVLIFGGMIAGIIRRNLISLGLITVLLFLSFIGPILSSNRSDIIAIFFYCIIIAYYFGKLRFTPLIMAAAASIAILFVLGITREQNQLGFRQLSSDSPIDRILGSGNSIDFVRTSSIMDRVPGYYPYQHGKTYIAWLAGPIPRKFWPHKPQIGLGGVVKEDIFHQVTKQGGYPSGVIAEGWINFGTFGLVWPLLLIGWLLRVFYESFRPLLGVSLVGTILYSLLDLHLTFMLAQLNFSHALVNALFIAVPMMVFLWFVRYRGVRR